MKRLISSLLAVLCIACSSDKGDNAEISGPATEDGTQIDDPSPREVIKILAIGNSFSEDAVEHEMYGLFEAVGQKVVIGNMYIGGCTLEKHCQMAQSDEAAYSYRKIVDGVRTVTKNVRLSEALKDEAWDYISFQQGGGFHGMYDTLEPSLSDLIAYCRSNSLNTSFEVIYHVPWAAQEGCTSEKFDYYDEDQMKMYGMIVETTKKICGEHDDFALVMNVMDAIQNGRTSFIGDTFCRDGWHLEKSYGRYTAGCLWFEKIMGLSCVDNSYRPASLSDAVAEVCRHAAHEACVNPYRITDLSHFVKPEDDGTADRKVLAKWHFDPERTFTDGCARTWCGQTSAGVFTYSNQPGERGFFNANGEGAGRLSYVQVDKTAWDDTQGDERAGLSIHDAKTGGQPVACGALPGDYWMFETTGGYEFEEGTRLRMSFSFHPSKYGAEYWMIEYLDGETWKPAFECQNITIKESGETFDYNFKQVEATRTPVDFTVTLENRTSEFKVRITCCSEYQVNGKWFPHPRRQSSQRIAGTPADGNLPVMEELF